MSLENKEKQNQDDAAQQVFYTLKPTCVSLSSALQIIHVNSKPATTMLERLCSLIQEQDPHGLKACYDYISFPLFLVLESSQELHVSIHLQESALLCFEELVKRINTLNHGKDGLSNKNAYALFPTIINLINPISKEKQNNKIKSSEARSFASQEELQIISLRILELIIPSAISYVQNYSNESTLSSSSSSSTKSNISTTNVTNNDENSITKSPKSSSSNSNSEIQEKDSNNRLIQVCPIVISSLLDLFEKSRSKNISVQCLNVLSIAIPATDPEEFYKYLPGVVSSLSRILSQDPLKTRGSKVFAAAVDVFVLSVIHTIQRIYNTEADQSIKDVMNYDNLKEKFSKINQQKQQKKQQKSEIKNNQKNSSLDHKREINNESSESSLLTPWIKQLDEKLSSFTSKVFSSSLTQELLTKGESFALNSLASGSVRFIRSTSNYLPKCIPPALEVALLIMNSEDKTPQSSKITKQLFNDQNRITFSSWKTENTVYNRAESLISALPRIVIHGATDEAKQASFNVIAAYINAHLIRMNGPSLSRLLSALVQVSEIQSEHSSSPSSVRVMMISSDHEDEYKSDQYRAKFPYFLFRNLHADLTIHTMEILCRSIGYKSGEDSEETFASVIDQCLSIIKDSHSQGVQPQTIIILFLIFQGISPQHNQVSQLFNRESFHSQVFRLGELCIDELSHLLISSRELESAMTSSPAVQAIGEILTVMLDTAHQQNQEPRELSGRTFSTVLEALLESLGRGNGSTPDRAYTSLQRLALYTTNGTNSSVAALAATHADYIVDSTCRKLKFPQLYPKAPVVLRALLDSIATEAPTALSKLHTTLLPMVHDAIDSLFSTLDNIALEPHRHLFLAQPPSATAKDRLASLRIRASSSPVSSLHSNEQQQKKGNDNSMRLECLLSLNASIRIIAALFPLLHPLSRSSVFQVDDNQDISLIEHVYESISLGRIIIGQVIEKAQHYVGTEGFSNRILVLDLLERCIMALIDSNDAMETVTNMINQRLSSSSSSHDKQQLGQPLSSQDPESEQQKPSEAILPLLYTVWKKLMLRMGDDNLRVVRKSIEVVSMSMQRSPGFLFPKFTRDVWPRIKKVIDRISSRSSRRQMELDGFHGIIYGTLKTTLTFLIDLFRFAQRQQYSEMNQMKEEQKESFRTNKIEQEEEKQQNEENKIEECQSDKENQIDSKEIDLDDKKSQNNETNEESSNLEEMGLNELHKYAHDMSHMAKSSSRYQIRVTTDIANTLAVFLDREANHSQINRHSIKENTSSSNSIGRHQSIHQDIADQVMELLIKLCDHKPKDMWLILQRWFHSKDNSKSVSIAVPSTIVLSANDDNSSSTDDDHSKNDDVLGDIRNGCITIHLERFSFSFEIRNAERLISYIENN